MRWWRHGKFKKICASKFSVEPSQSFLYCTMLRSLVTFHDRFFIFSCAGVVRYALLRKRERWGWGITDHRKKQLALQAYNTVCP